MPASESEDVGPLNMNVRLVDASAAGSADMIRTPYIAVLFALSMMRNGNETGSSEAGSALRV